MPTADVSVGKSSLRERGLSMKAKFQTMTLRELKQYVLKYRSDREAKTGLSSLFEQTAGVGVGFLVLLLVTGGNPPAFLVTLSFIFGVGFIARSEKKRFTKSRTSNFSP